MSQVRILLTLGVIILLGVVAMLYLTNRDARRMLTEQVEQAERTDEATTRVIEAKDDAVEVVHKTEVIVTEARDAYQRGYADAIRLQPVADWADEPVPPRLRDLARERRQARERSGGAGVGD